MSSRDLHIALLRPPVLQILRAAGFTATRPAVLDTVVDLASRYLTLLASKTALIAQSNHNDLTPTIVDTRMALQDVGAFWPQISTMEEQVREEEDMRGIEGFLEWMKGEANREIRRVAGLLPSDGEVIGTELEERVDFLTALKKKHSKTGEESRFQGTVLGIPAEDKPVIIEGGSVETIQDWEARLSEIEEAEKSPSIHETSFDESSVSSPLTDFEEQFTQLENES